MGILSRNAGGLFYDFFICIHRNHSRCESCSCSILGWLRQNRLQVLFVEPNEYGIESRVDVLYVTMKPELVCLLWIDFE